jgi:hypothetical protein
MPSKPITPERLRQIDAAAGCGLSDEEVARVVGVELGVLDRPKVRKALEKARAVVVQKVAAALIRKALAGNIPAAVFYLKAKAGWRDTDAALEREQEERRKRIPRILVIDDAQVDPVPLPEGSAGAKAAG